MITFGTLRDISSEYDACFVITRYLKVVPRNSIWLSEISPSSSLFYRVRKLKEENQWNSSTFNSIYVPIFLKEMKYGIGREYLNKIIQTQRDGKNILLACYCTDETMCHRSIIAGLMMGAGCDVDGLLEDNDYIKYYKMYKEL